MIWSACWRARIAACSAGLSAPLRARLGLGRLGLGDGALRVGLRPAPPRRRRPRPRRSTALLLGLGPGRLGRASSAGRLGPRGSASAWASSAAVASAFASRHR